MTSQCLHYDCGNRNSFGYCKTTGCINPKYNRLPIESTDNTSPAVVIKPCTNADRIRAMTDMELYKFICAHATCDRCGYASTSGYCGLIEWLRKEAEEL